MESATDSGLGTALARIGDRWSLLIVGAMLDGPQRFGELSGRIGGIAPNVLAQRLRQLERDRLLVAEAYSSRPVRYAYRLTATGADLAGTLRLLAHWGGHDSERPVTHEACGTEAEPRWWCPTCDRAFGDEELGEVRWV